MTVKQKLMVFASPRVKQLALSIAEGAEYHQPAGNVRYLGVAMDTHLAI